MQLENSNLKANQLIAVLAFSVSRLNDDDGEDETEKYLNKISYFSIAAVLWQYDSTWAAKSQEKPPTNSFFSLYNGTMNKKFKQKLSPEQLANLKSKSRCRNCGEWGHWSKEQNDDGSINFPSSSSNDKNKKKLDGKLKKNRYISHGIFSTSVFYNPVRPLLDDVISYSSIGFDGFKIIQPYVVSKWNGTLNELPKTVRDWLWWQHGTWGHGSEPKKYSAQCLLTVGVEKRCTH